MKNRFLLGGALAAVGAIALAAGVWYFVIRSDAPEEVSLEAALEAAETTTTTTTTTTAPSATATSGGTTSSNDGAAAANPAGTWNLVGGGSSFTGYRVQEQLVVRPVHHACHAC